MARKFGPQVIARPVSLRQRVEQAIAENRYQTGLDLARQLFRQEPLPEHRELLFRATVGRARQLREQRATNDAAAMFERAREAANGDTAKLTLLVDELAASGDYTRAKALFDSLPEPRPAIRIAERAADIALERGDKGRELLLPPWRGDYDRIRSAFGHLAAGRDDDARADLQAIGLQSPFLEWKLLLRGLLAYFQNEDARALENWQRLDVKLLPARIAALFRWQFDADFRSAQSPDAQHLYRQQSERLQGNAVLNGLRRIQKEFAKSEQSRYAFNELQTLLPAIQQACPQLLPKLTNCFYWHVVHHGEFGAGPNAYRKWFGAPADDPDLVRMEALMHESDKRYGEANRCWKSYAAALPQLTAIFPGDENTKAQAMVWHRMGQNAQKQDEMLDMFDSMPIFAFAPPDRRPKKLPQSAADCFQRAAKLAPTWREPHLSLLGLHRKSGNDRAAIEIARRILKFNPDDLPTLRALADALLAVGENGEAAKVLERALSLNPLLSELHPQLLRAKQRHAIELLLQKRIDEARSAVSALQQLLPSNVFLLALAAAADYLAGESARAELALQKVADADPNRPVVAAFMLGLASALKLPKAVKSRFDKEFKAWLAAPPTPRIAASLAVTFAMYETDKFQYFGLQSHRKKALSLAQKIVSYPFSIDEMRSLGSALLTMRQLTLLKRLAPFWRLQHPRAPEPDYFEVEARLVGSDDQWPIWRVRPMLETAKKKVELMAANPYKEQLAKSINARLQQFEEIDPSLMRDFAKSFGPFFDEDDDEG